MPTTIPLDWLPRVTMLRLHWHWTAGTYNPNVDDLDAYHLLIDGEGRWHRGRASIALNSGGIKPGYAAHTLNGNSGAIGISLCGMGGATEAPLSFGRWPLRPRQFDALVAGSRQLGAFYDIPADPRRMLSHAEVEATLGIKQRNKWDWSRLPQDITSLRGARQIGDWLRGRIAGKELSVNVPASKEALIPAGATGRVSTNGGNLNTRNGPDGAVTGSLPHGTEIKVLGEQGEWLQVRTPSGFDVWAARRYIDIIDGPRPAMPTQPDPRRAMIAEFRAFLDRMESEL